MNRLSFLCPRHRTSSTCHEAALIKRLFIHWIGSSILLSAFIYSFVLSLTFNCHYHRITFYVSPAAWFRWYPAEFTVFSLALPEIRERFSATWLQLAEFYCTPRSTCSLQQSGSYPEVPLIQLMMLLHAGLGSLDYLRAASTIVQTGPFSRLAARYNEHLISW